MLSTSVVIVSYQTGLLTMQAVQSALAGGADEVVVVDNASADDTIPLLSSLSQARLRLLRHSVNWGFGRAANQGVAEASHETILFLNSDAEMADSVQTLFAELARLKGRAIVGPRLVAQDGAVQRSAGLLPRPSDLMIRALGMHAVAGRLAHFPVLRDLIGRSRIAREYASAESATETIDTNMVSGACFAIGRKAFEELGGFDERFFMYFEDADLCRRATAAGMPIRYVPSAVVGHIGGASSSKDYHFGPLHARSMRQYLGKWYGPGGSALAIVLLWVRAVSFSLAVRPGASRAWSALWAAVRDEDPRQ